MRLRFATTATFAVDPVRGSFMALLTTRCVGVIAVAVAIRQISVAGVLVSAQSAATGGVRAGGAFVRVAEVVDVGFGWWGSVCAGLGGF